MQVHSFISIFYLNCMSHIYCLFFCTLFSRNIKVC
jgi:hypothetical protein